jgi:hypothetical protein
MAHIEKIENAQSVPKLTEEHKSSINVLKEKNS